MFTATEARSLEKLSLDEKIEYAVNEAIQFGHRNASIRVYCEDWYKDSIREELSARGFVVLYVPDICIKGDVSFTWTDEDN